MIISGGWNLDIILTVQMAEWYRASVFGSVDLGFDSESGQTNDFEIGIHSFPACRSAFKGQCEQQAGKFTCCTVGKGTYRDSPILVW